MTNLRTPLMALVIGVGLTGGTSPVEAATPDDLNKDSNTSLSLSGVGLAWEIA